jgi:hypothetical protein
MNEERVLTDVPPPLFQKLGSADLETRVNSCTTEGLVRHTCFVIRGADPDQKR